MDDARMPERMVQPHFLFCYSCVRAKLTKNLVLTSLLRNPSALVSKLNTHLPVFVCGDWQCKGEHVHRTRRIHLNSHYREWRAFKWYQISLDSDVYVLPHSKKIHLNGVWSTHLQRLNLRFRCYQFLSFRCSVSEICSNRFSLWQYMNAFGMGLNRPAIWWSD